MLVVYATLILYCLHSRVTAVPQSDGAVQACTSYNEVLPSDGACSEYLQDVKIALHSEDIKKRDDSLKKIIAAINLAKSLSKETLEMMMEFALTSCPEENKEKIIKLALSLLSHKDISDYSTCFTEQKWLMCHTMFPVCIQNNKNKAVVSLPCRENCVKFQASSHCSKLIKTFQVVLDNASLCPKTVHIQDVYLHMGLKDCEKFINRNHNYFMQCQLREPISGKLQKSDSCYERGKTVYYGDISTTNTGKTCLDWHTENLPHKLYPTLHKNYCRNPQGFGNKPWCYVGGNGEWEYCDVRNCHQVKKVKDQPPVLLSLNQQLGDAPPIPLPKQESRQFADTPPPVQKVQCNDYKANSPPESFCSVLEGLNVALKKDEIKERNIRLSKFLIGIELAHTMNVAELTPLLELALDRCHSEKEKKLFITEAVELFQTINFKDLDECINNNKRMICQLNFPLCFKYNNKTIRSNLCYESCIEYETRKPCSTVIELIKKASKFTSLCLEKIKDKYLHEGIKDCKHFQRKDQNSIEKCQLWSSKSGLTSKSDICYENDKTTYVGSLSVTKSGKKCLPWNSDLPSKLYPTLDSNFCRNPQGHDSHPWCYVGPNGEWEHCEVAQCEKLKKHKIKKQIWFYILSGCIIVVFVAAFVAIILRKRKKGSIKMEPVSRNEYQDEWLQTRYIPVSPPIEVYEHESDIDKKH